METLRVHDISRFSTNNRVKNEIVKQAVGQGKGEQTRTRRRRLRLSEAGMKKKSKQSEKTIENRINTRKTR